MKTNEDKAVKKESFFQRHKMAFLNVGGASIVCGVLIVVNGCLYSYGYYKGKCDGLNISLSKSVREDAVNKLVEYVILNREKGLNFSRTVTIDGKDVIQHVKLFASEITTE